MVSPRSGPGRPGRLALVLTTLVVLLGLVAFASRSGVGGSSRAQPSPGYVNWAVSVLFVLWLLMIPLMAYAYWLQLPELRARKRRSSQARLLKGIGFILVIPPLIGVIMWIHARHGLGSGPHLPGLLAGRFEAGGKRAAHRYDPAFQWPVLWGALALLVAAGGWVWWQRRKRGVAPPVGAPSIADDVTASISDAIDDLAAEPDARRAVIAAYARMEGAFARHGLNRAPSETPVEYLRRLLLGLTSRADAVTRLTALFERAKFSHHEIDGTMKQDAIEALREIRDDLQPA